MSTNINDTASSGFNIFKWLEKIKRAASVGWNGLKENNIVRDMFSGSNQNLNNAQDTISNIILNSDEPLKYDNLSDVGFWEALDNYFTGNLDYQRQLQLTGIQNAYNALEAEKARNWSKLMSSTEYQRTIKDLASAGLNPYAVVSSGSVNSTPSTSTAHNSANYTPGKNGFVSLVGALSSAMSIFSDALLQERKFDKLAERDTHLSMLTKHMKEDLLKDTFRHNVNLTRIRNDLKSFYNSKRDEEKHSYRLDELKSKSGYNLNRDAKKWRYIKEFKDEW